MVVAPECALQHTLELLKRVVDELWASIRSSSSPRSPATSVGPAAMQKIMSANFSDLEFLSSILSGLTKLKFLLRKKLAPTTVLDGIELIYGSMWSRSWERPTLSTQIKTSTQRDGAQSDWENCCRQQPSRQQERNARGVSPPRRPHPPEAQVSTREGDPLRVDTWSTAADSAVSPKVTWTSPSGRSTKLGTDFFYLVFCRTYNRLST